MVNRIPRVPENKKRRSLILEFRQQTRTVAMLWLFASTPDSCSVLRFEQSCSFFHPLICKPNTATEARSKYTFSDHWFRSDQCSVFPDYDYDCPLTLESWDYINHQDQLQSPLQIRFWMRCITILFGCKMAENNKDKGDLLFPWCGSVRLIVVGCSSTS